jgi:hypothetical protein
MASGSTRIRRAVLDIPTDFVACEVKAAAAYCVQHPICRGYLVLDLREMDSPMGKDVTVKLIGQRIELKAGRLSWIKVREYWENRPWPFVLMVLLTLGSPFLGLFLAGWIGVFIGLTLGILATAVGFFAVTRVRETERGG